jgi:hypothetical protein
MTFNIRIDSRNFSSLPLKPFATEVKQLSWSAFGGPDQALVSAFVPADRLFDFASLLRCPITVSDHTAEPAWWGYIHTIVIYYDQVKFTITLDQLFNKVKVLYTYLAPDSLPAEYQETPFAQDAFSQSEYGIKERVLLRHNIDDDFALALRDIFLQQSAKPRSILAPALDDPDLRIDFHCKGWIHSLGWRFYQDLEGFYANHGPGPGFVYSGDLSYFSIDQRFYVQKDVNLKYAFFLVRKVGTPTADTFCTLRADGPPINPGDIIATSAGIAGSTFPSTGFSWVKYTFSPAVSLSASTYYWIGFRPTAKLSADASNYYSLRTDENATFNPMPNLYAKRMNAAGTGWYSIPNITQPGLNPDLHFRVICTIDSGQLLKDMATATGDFITAVNTSTSGVLARPYRIGDQTTLEGINILMQLGTANQRLILANVDLNRRLTVYEQPPADQPTAYMDQAGRFYTQNRVLLPPWRPPVGQYAALAGADHFVPRFDHRRIPTYFVDRFTYRPPTYG